MTSGSMTKEDFKITKEESERLQAAFKDETFRKLFFEYAQELNNPESRKLYESEIAQLEAERGNKIRWVKPEPFMCVKTWLDDNGKEGAKCFINISSSKEIKKAYVQPDNKSKSQGKSNWKIPHSLQNPRKDLDKSKKEVTVYDVVFHPETLAMTLSSAQMNALIIEVAMERIQANQKVKFLNKTRIMKNVKYMGVPTPSVFREPIDSSKTPSQDEDPLSSLRTDLDHMQAEMRKQERAENLKKNTRFFNQPESPLISQAQDLLRCEPERKSIIEEIVETEPRREDPPTTAKAKLIKPTFSIIEREMIGMQKFAFQKPGGGHNHLSQNTRPSEIDVKIQLPGVSSKSEIDLDIDGARLILKAADKYYLNLTLPYPVNESDGRAKFISKSSTLLVSLPVIPRTPAEEEASRDESTSAPQIQMLSEETPQIEEMHPNPHQSSIEPSSEISYEESAVVKESDLEQGLDRIHEDQNISDSNDLLLPEPDESETLGTIPMKYNLRHWDRYVFLQVFFDSKWCSPIISFHGSKIMLSFTDEQDQPPIIYKLVLRADTNELWLDESINPTTFCQRGTSTSCTFMGRFAKDPLPSIASIVLTLYQDNEAIARDVKSVVETPSLNQEESNNVSMPQITTGTDEAKEWIGTEGAQPSETSDSITNESHPKTSKFQPRLLFQSSNLFDLE